MKPVSTVCRILVAVASLSLVVTYFVPVWRIDLSAPQYPEGLSMQIWLTKLSGDVDIINGLNHYIGMATLHAESFPEFAFLPYIVAFYIATGLLTALIGKRPFLLGYLILLLLGAIVALGDFYRWGYEYGHNLDPNAAIQVPGMSYQPPVIGFKNLLNFGAWSVPDSGGWVFIIAGILIAGVYIYEAFFQKEHSQKGFGKIVALVSIVWFVSGCTVESEPIQYGKDNCHFCKMGMADTKFGAEIVTKKGKVYKFDDVNCMLNYQATGDLPAAEIALQLVADFANPKTLIPVEGAFFLAGSEIHSPMNSQVAAFQSEQSLQKASQNLPGEVLDWLQVSKKFKK
ncbi:nitrous oxide reductase accessory protein NosL [Xanthocytophaga flava]|uniref:nitrous oxide reductase accessory protein NosL n=1 Tax=Xanthocytophaga flava TaxID=3048013 RepID=UPI0028D68ED8|nr:nitrous oxide reductase accessory protein NosL [Xanthocytophaga flavus]MDJ1472325.1 nitrous oxide reductase accessory protein NosL [Xanthocytophaga flavus]